MSITRQVLVAEASRRMFTTHSAESEHPGLARIHNSRATRGIPGKALIPAAHVTSYRRLRHVRR
jgi:hypothetical protein